VDGTSTGGHYNPDQFNHGLPGVAIERHVGDLGTIKTFVEQTGFYSFAPEYLPVSSLTVDNIIGRAVIVHQTLDHGNDSTCGLEALTTGAAGLRIYYCVIGIPNTANQSIPTNFLPTPVIPPDTIFNNVWENVPCGESSTENDDELDENLEIAHAIIMIISFSIALPVGILFARYGKDLPNDMWFTVHRTVQPVGYVFSCIGLIIALVMVNGHHFDTVWHGQLGLTLILITLPQIIFGIFRPKVTDEQKTSTRRVIFERVHPWFGRLLIVVAIVQTYGGLTMAGAGGGWIFLYTLLIIGLIVTVVVLEIRTRPRLRERMADWVERNVPAGDMLGSCLRPGPGPDML